MIPFGLLPVRQGLGRTGILFERRRALIAQTVVRRFTYLLSLTFGSIVWGQEGSAADYRASDSLSFLEAYSLARENTPSLAIARFQIEGAEAQRDVARGKFFPQVSLFGDWSENKVNYENSGALDLPSQEYPGERYGLQLRSPIFNMRSVKEYERNAALVNQSERELELAEAELLSSLVQTYLLVLLAEEDANQIEVELTALRRQLAEAEALYEKSLIPVTQVLETQVRVDSLWADLIDAKGQAALAYEKLVQQVGVRRLALRPVAEHISLYSEFVSAEAAAERAATLDPASRAAEEAVKAARKGVDREKGSWWPEVDFVYSSQYSDVGFDNLTSPPRSTQSYSISVRYPLFEGGAGSARLRGAWAEFYTAQQRLKATRRQSDSRARAAWVNLKIADERISAARQAAKTAKVNLDASRKAVRAGTARVTDVLLALAQNTRAQRDLSEARYLRAIGWLELELAVGADPVMLATQFSNALHGP